MWFINSVLAMFIDTEGENILLIERILYYRLRESIELKSLYSIPFKH